MNPEGSVFYKDEYDQFYDTQWETINGLLDITTIIKQPFVLGQKAEAFIKNGILFRKGTLLIERQVLKTTVDGYEIIASGSSSSIDFIQMNFPCGNGPKDIFKYHYDCAVSDQIQFLIQEGSSWFVIDSEETILSALLAPEETVWGTLDSLGNTLDSNSLKWLDVWNNYPTEENPTEENPTEENPPVEPPNLLLDPTDFNGAAWTLNLFTANGLELTEIGGLPDPVFHSVQQTVALTPSGITSLNLELTLSVTGRTWIQLMMSCFDENEDEVVYSRFFQLSGAGALGTLFYGNLVDSDSITHLGAGVYQISVALTTPITSFLEFFIFGANADNSFSGYTGNSGVYAFQSLRLWEVEPPTPPVNLLPEDFELWSMGARGFNPVGLTLTEPNAENEFDITAHICQHEITTTANAFHFECVVQNVARPTIFIQAISDATGVEFNLGYRTGNEAAGYFDPVNCVIEGNSVTDMGGNWSKIAFDLTLDAPLEAPLLFTVAGSTTYVDSSGLSYASIPSTVYEFQSISLVAL